MHQARARAFYSATFKLLDTVKWDQLSPEQKEKFNFDYFYPIFNNYRHLGAANDDDYLTLLDEYAKKHREGNTTGVVSV